MRRQRPSQTLGPFYGGRNRVVAVVFFGVFTVLAGRAVTIHILSPSADILESLARRQYQTRIDLSPYRGNIYDRRGEPLAISIRRPSFYVNPRIFDPTSAQTKQLSQQGREADQLLRLARPQSGAGAGRETECARHRRSL